MNSLRESSCISSLFEKDKVLRTNLPMRCLRVLFHRSTWFVSPLSLPTIKCLPVVITWAYTSQQSLNVWQRRYAFGIRCQKTRQLFSLRSPMKYATTCRVLRHKAIQTQRLKFLHHTYDHNSSNSKTSFSWAGSSVVSIWGSDRAFFYPVGYRLSSNVECSGQPAKRTTFLTGPDNQFFRGFIGLTAFNYTTRAAALALVTRIANAVATVLDQIVRTTNRTSLNLYYHVFAANI